MLLESNGVQYQVCGGVEPNPSKETVYRITYHLLAKGFPSMLAVGGGSVMDAAKAAGILATVKEGELDDYFGVGMVSKKIRRGSCPSSSCRPRAEQEANSPNFQ